MKRILIAGALVCALIAAGSAYSAKQQAKKQEKREAAYWGTKNAQ